MQIIKPKIQRREWERKKREQKVRKKQEGNEIKEVKMKIKIETILPEGN